MKHADPPSPRSRYYVTLTTARSGERAYVVSAVSPNHAIVEACGRATEDDAAWHVLDVVGVKRLGV
jgi:hypothetical protein